MKRDIPKLIAGVLWACGAIWAVSLLILALVGLPIFVLPPLLFGLVVWFGWLWRSQKLQPMVPAMCVWVASLLANGWWLLPRGDSDEAGVVLISWWMLAAVASAVALVCEIWIEREKTPD